MSARFVKSSFLVLVLLGTACALPGCARLGVVHLQPQPMRINAPQVAQMHYWRFEYTVEPMREGFGIRSRAFPVRDRFPENMSWIETLSFSVYLSDSSGKVVSWGEIELTPRPLDPSDECGIPFDFVLAPEPASCGPLNVAFGYGTTLTPGRLDTSEDDVFFAEEGAVKR